MYIYIYTLNPTYMLYTIIYRELTKPNKFVFTH